MAGEAPPPTQQQQQSAPPQAFAAQLPLQQQEHQEPQPPQRQQQQQCSPPTAFAMGVGSADVHVKAPPQDALACDGICREQWEEFGWEGVMNRAHSSEVILQPPIQQQQQQQQAQAQAQAPPQHRVPVNINILMEEMSEVIIGVGPIAKAAVTKAVCGEYDYSIVLVTSGLALLSTLYR